MVHCVASFFNGVVSFCVYYYENKTDVRFISGRGFWEREVFRLWMGLRFRLGTHCTDVDSYKTSLYEKRFILDLLSIQEDSDYSDLPASTQFESD
jgi:hypothetical protein